MDFVMFNAGEGTTVPVLSVTGYPSTGLRTPGVAEPATDKVSRA
jgi:hypothetical protein